MRPVLATVILLLASAAAAQAPRAYSYEFRLDPGGKKGGDVIEGTVRVSGSRARVDTDEQKPEDDRSYFLLADGGRRVYVVHPERRTYEEHDADEFAHVVGMAMRAVGPVLKISVRDVRLDTARLGAGEPVAGRATQRVQLRQRWTTSMRVLGFVQEDMGGSSVAEYWADPSLPLMRNPLFDIVSTALMAFPLVSSTYQQPESALVVPGPGTVLRTVFIRSAFFLVVTVPVITAWARSRRSLILSLAFAFFVMVGLAGLVSAHWLPVGMRSVHAVEILADSLVYAWVLAKLLVPRTSPRPVVGSSPPES